MAATAAIIVIGSIVGGAVGKSNAKNNAPKIPAEPEKPKEVSQSQMDTLAEERKSQIRKQAVAASGRSDTILTSPLGEVNPQDRNFANMGKTLLGQ